MPLPGHPYFHSLLLLLHLILKIAKFKHTRKGTEPTGMRKVMMAIVLSEVVAYRVLLVVWQALDKGFYNLSF
jgi:hypothetical protein